MSDFIQKLFTTRQNYDNGDTRIGEKERIWYDSNTNTLRIQLDDTPGGTIIGGGGAGGDYTLPTASTTVKGGVKIDGTTITINNQVISGFSGSYTDLTNKPTIPAAQVNSDWTASSGVAQILNKPALFSGSYNDLTNKPTIPDAYTLPTATDSILGGVKIGNNISIDAGVISVAAPFSGSYTDLTDQPTIYTSAYIGTTSLDFSRESASQTLTGVSIDGSVVWTNPSPTPADNFKTIISANDGTATITLLDGMPGFGGSEVWAFDKDKITFPDATTQSTAAVAQIQSDWNQTADTELDYIKNKPTIPDITDIEDALAATGEPMGHKDRSQSVISFDDASRTFSISPVSGSFEIWTKGVKRTITDTRTVTIPDTTGLYYIYFDTNGTLQQKTTVFDWPNDCITAYVYWNDQTNDAPFVADERHGITLDWQTHEYLHRTRGAAIANGFGATNYIVGADGSSDTHMQLDIASGTFFDEDLQVDIVDTNTPVANTWDQDLSGPAKIPMFYINSGGGWVMDEPTNFPVKQGTLPKYNLYSDGVWTTPDIDNNKFGVTFIIATNNINYPVIGIIGQAQRANIGDAEATEFSDLNLAGFPVVEMRPLYKLVYECKGSYTNSVNARLMSVWDQRNFSSTGSAIATYTDHGALGGLGDDDHPQYLLRTEAPTTVTVNGTSITLGSSGTVTADANTLTGTTLKSTVVSSSLTSVGTLTGVTSNAATAFIAGDAAISGIALQIPREGAIRNLYNGANTMYFDVSIGGSTQGSFQFRSSSSYTNVLTMSSTGVNFNTGAPITGQTPSVARLAWNSVIDTELTVGDYRFRVSNSGGIFPQIISNTDGTKDTAWTAVGAISGSAVAQAGSTGNLVPNNSWVSLYTLHGMDNAGDTVTVTLQDKSAGRIYRVTFMRSNSAIVGLTGYNIIAERLL